MGTCCFGGQPKATDMIEVKIKADAPRVEYSTPHHQARRQVRPGGTIPPSSASSTPSSTISKRTWRSKIMWDSAIYAHFQPWPNCCPRVFLHPGYVTFARRRTCPRSLFRQPLPVFHPPRSFPPCHRTGSTCWNTEFSPAASCGIPPGRSCTKTPSATRGVITSAGAPSSPARTPKRAAAPRTSGSSTSPAARTTSGGARSTSSSTPHVVHDQPPAGHRLPQHARAAVRRRRLRRLGPAAPASRFASSAPRPYHALFMHNMLIRPTRRRAGELRRARLRDLQRRPVPGQPHTPQA